MRQPRKYAPIWEKLKAERTCIIVAPPGLHKRIVKAVIKEKDKDTGFKFQQSEACLHARLSYLIDAQKQSVITFKLSFHQIKTPDIGEL